MAQILKLAQFVQDNAVPQMDVGTGWINAELHPERPIQRELLL